MKIYVLSYELIGCQTVENIGVYSSFEKVIEQVKAFCLEKDLLEEDIRVFSDWDISVPGYNFFVDDFEVDRIQ